MGDPARFDYTRALAYISSTGRFGIKMGLERTRALLDEVGAPDLGMRGVLVAGTNGKGSTCAFLASILRMAGFKVAEMPKPHLVSYTERVVVDGRAISERAFAQAVRELVPAVDRVTAAHGAPTEFEILTTLALRYARERKAELLVCEVGMGGRLDATNITDLGVKVITSIDLDHQKYLGDTVPLIAAEKAGIIREGDIVVAGALVGDALTVVEERCALVGAELVCFGRDFAATKAALSWDGTVMGFEAAEGHWLHSLPRLATSLLGTHQARNAAVAVAAAQAMARRHELEVGDLAIRDGIAAATLPGRLELFAGRPRVLVDGGHNPAAVAEVVKAVEELKIGPPPVLLFGAMADKDLAGMLRLLPPEWPVVFTQVAEERAIPAATLGSIAADLGRQGDTTEADAAAALEMAGRRAGADGMVLVLGSLYLAGAVRRLLTRRGEVTTADIVEAWQ